MAHSDFSWTKVLCFFGALACVFVAIVTISSGISLAVGGRLFNGVMTCLGGGASIALAVILYRYYQKWADKYLSNVK